MKRLIIIVLAIILFSSPTLAQPGSIALLSDAGGTNCNLFDQVPGLVTVYVFHLYSPGATGAQFKVESGPGVTLLFIGETSPYLTIGQSENGIAIAFQGCYTSPNHLLTINYIGNGTSEICSQMEVVPDPTATIPGIYVTDCADPPNLLTATGGGLVVNPESYCMCSPFMFSDVTVTTDPEGLEIEVDAVHYTSPEMFTWIIGSLHTIGVDSPQELNGDYYQFSNWSDGSTITHNIAVPNENVTVTATFDPLQDITVTTDPEGLDITVDGSGYTSPEVFHWLEGSSHEIGVELSQLVDDTIYVFSHWSDWGAITHDITVPAMDAVYTATYTSVPAAAVIDSIVDVPADQGGWVRIYFQRSGYDKPEEPDYPIATYNIWQRMDDAAIARTVLSAEKSAPTDESFGMPMVEWNGRRFLISSPELQAGDFPPGIWEVVGSFAAAQQEQYIYRAPTVMDKIGSQIFYSVYAVSAHTTTPSIWFMSQPDSGYSVDNLSPAAPSNLSGHYEGAPDYLTLEWDPNTEADLCVYRVYIGEGEDFVPLEDNLEATTAQTMLTGIQMFPVEPWYFKVSAVDVHGNESGFAVLAPEYISIPTFVASHQSAWTGKAVEVNWTIADAPSEILFRTYRKDGNTGEFKETLFEITRNGDEFGFADKSTLPNENYTYQITVRNGDREDVLFETAITTPSLKLALKQNFPNPFQMGTTIPFDLPEEMRVEVTVYDIAGRKVRTLLNGIQAPGSHELPFDGRGLASGIYFYQLKAGNKTFTKKLVLTK
jgi:hypothetical protein